MKNDELYFLDKLVITKDKVHNILAELYKDPNMTSNGLHSFFDIIKTALIILPPAVLVFKQPDLGTSLTFAAVFIGMVYYAGATVTDIVVIVSPLLSLIFNAIDLNY